MENISNRALNSYDCKNNKSSVLISSNAVADHIHLVLCLNFKSIGFPLEVLNWSVCNKALMYENLCLRFACHVARPNSLKNVRYVNFTGVNSNLRGCSVRTVKYLCELIGIWCEYVNDMELRYCADLKGPLRAWWWNAKLSLGLDVYQYMFPSSRLYPKSWLWELNYWGNVTPHHYTPVNGKLCSVQVDAALAVSARNSIQVSDVAGVIQRKR